MSSAKERAVALAVTLIHTLVDEEQWQKEFREFFEEIELFHSIETRVEAGVITVNIFMHDPQDLEKLIKHPFEFVEDDIECVPTIDDAEEVVAMTITKLRMKQ